jgi:hypothetical protein
VVGPVIVTRTEDGWTLVRQVDHQDQCAAMARAWGNATFAAPGDRPVLETAAAMHDEGWRQWEERPRVDGHGRPMDFPDVDRAEHVALYRRGIDAAEARDPRAGLLVSMHGAGLYRGRMGLDHVVPGNGDRPAVVEDFLAHEDARQARLRGGLVHGPADERWEWAAYRCLQAWDLLSLALLWGRLSDREAITLRRVPRSEDDDAGVDITVRPAGRWRATLDPWPFREADDGCALPVRAREIPSVALGGDDALAAALDAAPWIDLPAWVGSA